MSRMRTSNGIKIPLLGIPIFTDSISHNSVSFIQEDKNGVLWLSTYGGGLNKFDPTLEKFSHYRYDKNDANGLNKYNPTTNTFTTYRAKNDLSGDLIAGIPEDTQGNLWISTNNGLSKFDPQAETLHIKEKL